MLGWFDSRCIEPLPTRPVRAVASPVRRLPGSPAV